MQVLGNLSDNCLSNWDADLLEYKEAISGCKQIFSDQIKHKGQHQRVHALLNIENNSSIT